MTKIIRSVMATGHCQLVHLWILAAYFLLNTKGASLDEGAQYGFRAKRQTSSRGQSILTVEWEGIHSGLQDDSAISGFLVEYRPEGETTWRQQDGIIPYKGANFQYRVRIRDLPSNSIYFVRIKVVGRNNEILVKTPEIKAQSETVKFDCKGDVITQPRNVQIGSTADHTIQFIWDAPECGNIMEYEYELFGESNYALFELHRGTTKDDMILIRNLLPGTRYNFRIRALDFNQKKGTFTSQRIETSTEGRTPAVSSGIRLIYKSDSEIRVEWDPFRDTHLQHYEVTIVEKTRDGGIQQNRATVPSGVTSYIFKSLKPSTDYIVGVIAFVDNNPKQVYQLNVETGQRTVQKWTATPTVEKRGMGMISVHWEEPSEFRNQDIKGFIIEYKMPNETTWHRYGEVIDYVPGKSDYRSQLSGLSENIFYQIRVYMVNRKNEVVAITEEFSVGQGSDTSCTGLAGVPQGVDAYYIGQTSITYRWRRPECDESYGPIEGFEYLFWNLDRGSEPERPSYTPGTQVTLDRLTPDHRYAFRVRSRSRGGQTPWTETLKATTKQDGQDDGNIYHLRIVLAPPKSYLVWTPLPEHQGRIERFRLSYKVSTTEDWTRIEDNLQRFQCPEGIGNGPGDFCFDLTGLTYGVQYTSDLVYRLDNSDWSKHGNPLFFILVEAGAPKLPSAPIRLTYTLPEPTVCSLSWLPPLSDVRIQDYKITVRVLSSNNPSVTPGIVYSMKTPGKTYSQIVDNLYPDTFYNISVQAGSQGFYGPAAWEVFSTGVKSKAEIDRPQIEQRANMVRVSWNVRGTLKDLCCYQIDLRNERQSQWEPYGGRITQEGNQRSYSQELSGLQGNTQYFIRIRAMDKTARQTEATSDPVSLTTQCQAPTAPPSGIQVSASDPRTVFLQWTPPDRSTWGCTEVWYHVEGTANGRPQKFRVQSDPRGFKVEHRIPSEPNTDWRIRIQTVNSGGESPWSREFGIRTETDALVSIPRLTARGAEIAVNWQSQGSGAGKVIGYRIEYRSSRDPRWTPHGSMVPYIGDNKQYSGNIDGLQIGETYLVRIQVLDANQRELYTSPEATARTTCEPPSQPPINVQVTAPDPGHVRVTWLPPGIESWNCNEVYFELKVLEPEGMQPVRLSSRQQTHVLNSRPNQRWSVQLRTVNAAGSSPWSRAIGARTSPPGELIIGPTVSYQQEIPILSWRSISGVDDLVAGYKIEINPESRPGWSPHSSGMIRYTGWQRPYTVPMPDLPEGERVQARVTVMDHNNGLQYTSPAVSIQMPSKCRPPSSAPAGITAQALGVNQIRLMWQPLTRSQWNCDQLWYIVKYSTPTSQGFKNYTAVESNGIFDSDPFTTWRFQIQAVNPSGPSQWSREVGGSTLQDIPGAIRGLRVLSVDTESATLTWQEPLNPNGVITGYDINYQLLSRGMCQEIPEREMTASSPSPTFTLRNLYPHSKYRISVAARTNKAGERVGTEVQTEGSTPSAAPRSLRGDGVTSTRVTLSWQAPPCLETNGDITEYEYELRGVDPWAVNDQRKGSIGETRTNVDGLTPYTKYRAQVRAYTSKGPGPWSSEVIVTTNPADSPLAPPMLRIVDTQADSVQLLWQSPYPPHGEIESYKIRHSQGGTGQWQEREYRKSEVPCSPSITSSQRIQVPPGATLHCVVVLGLQPEFLYDFQVAARISSGRSFGPWSRTESARTSGGPVQVLSVDKIGGSESHLEIRWNVRATDQPRVIGFRVIAAPASGGQGVQQYQVDGSTYRYRIDGLSGNTIYNVSVQARTQSGYHGGRDAMLRTDDARIGTVTLPPRVTDSQPTNLTVEWDEPRENRAITAYIVEYRNPPSGSWSRNEPMTPHQSGRGKFSSMIRGLAPNTEFEIRVRTMGANQRMGDPSPTTVARTRCSPPTSPPQGIRVGSSGPREVRLTWVRSGPSAWQCDQMGTEVWYQAHGQQPRTQRVTSDQTEYTLPSAPHTSWVVKLRSTNQVGVSPWSEEFRITTKQGAPGQVRNLQLFPESPNEVLVSWLEPLEKQGVIVGYDVSYKLKHRLACPDEEPKDVSRDWVRVYNLKDLSYKLTGLLPFSEYEVKVQARTTELGPEVHKTTSTRQTPPSAPPLDLKVTYTLERSLSFQWDVVECSQRHGHITNYEYELMGQDDWAKLERQIANTTEQTVDISGLTPFTKYVMRVKAYNGAGGGPNTENLEVMTEKADAPLPPQDLIVLEEGTDFFVISWLPPYPPWGPHDSFKVRYREYRTDRWTEVELPAGDRRLQCVGVDSGPRMCLNITGLEPGRTYNVQSAARIQGGNYGQWSEEATANTLEILPDSCISIQLIGKTDSSLHIGWVPPQDPQRRITEYQVLVEKFPKEPGSEPQSFRVEAPKTDYKIENLEPDTFYNITVRAGTKRGFGPGISTRHSTDKFQIPRTRRPTLTPVGADQITIEWNGVVDPQNKIKGYILEFRRSEDPTWQEHSNIIRHDNVKRTYMEQLRGLSPDATYMIRVKVVDHRDRVGDPSDEAEARTGCDAPTSPPVNVRLSAPNPRQVRIVWQAPPASSWLCSNIGFRLKYRNGTLGSLEEVKLPSSVGEHTLPSEPHTKWTIQLRTENPVGNSEWTDQVTITTPEDAPSEVRNVRGQPEGPNSMEISWDEPENPNGEIKGYTVTYFLKAKTSCPIRPGQPMVKHVMSRNQVIRDLEPASTYEVMVSARTSKEGPPSRPIMVTTEEATPTGAPERLSVGTISQTTVSLDWAEPRCELQNGQIRSYEYEVEALDDWISNKQKAGQESDSSTELAGLTPYTRYRFRVRATNSKGTGPFSEFVEFTTKPGPPPPPTDLIAEQAQPHAIEISFLPPIPPHGLIDEYRARHTIKNRVSWTDLRHRVSDLACASGDEKRLCYRVTELEAEEPYIIQVAAHTVDGDWGEWSETLDATTTRAELPVPEEEMRIEDRGPTSITVAWDGLSGVKTKNLDGYILEYSLGGPNRWLKHNDVISLKGQSGGTYRETVPNLQSDTIYFFRLKVAHKSGQHGLPGPVAKGRTLCGAPMDPPSNVNLESTNYNTVIVTWNNPPESSWKCQAVSLVLKYENSTHSGYIDLDPTKGERHEFTTRPGTKWVVQMRTQAMDSDGAEKGRASEWSLEKSIVTQGLPGSVFVDLNPIEHDKIQVIWDLPEEDKNWEYGVDVTYQLLQKGRCPRERGFIGTNYEVMDKRVLLENLEPYSIYEVIVTPRTPAHLASQRLQPPRVVQEIRTGQLAPSGEPEDVKLDGRTRESLAFRWQRPDCEKERGEITQYEYELRGVDDWVAGIVYPDVTTRLFVSKEGLEPGTRYSFKVRAYTSEGPGPWSDPLEVKTTGSVLGPPRELHTVNNVATNVIVSWLPPYPLRGKIKAYRLKYNVHTSNEDPMEVTMRTSKLSCDGVSSIGSIITDESLCHTLNLEPRTTYRMTVQARTEGGDWGDWSRPHYVTTIPPGPVQGGSLDLVTAGSDNIKVRWSPPGGVERITYYLVRIRPALAEPSGEPPVNVSQLTNNYRFKNLKPTTPYNISVEGGADGTILWHVSKRFSTTDKPSGLLSWLSAPTDLHLIDKTHTMMDVEWQPPEILLPQFRELITHYRVTIAPFDPQTSKTGNPTVYTVPVPGTRIKFENLEPDTIYNITVQAGTATGYGEVLWGSYSTLEPPGYPHILRLRYRTPNSLHVEWNAAEWGLTGIKGYVLKAYPLHSLSPRVNYNKVKAVELDSDIDNHLISGLTPSTIYKVTLTPKGKSGEAWGAYATLPPGWFMVKNLKVCQETNFALSLSWDGVKDDGATRYQVRYATEDMNDWIELDTETEGKSKYELRCPNDPCGKLCYLIFNLAEGTPDGLTVQVRAMVNREWNRWKTAVHAPSAEPKDTKKDCCIVAPPYFVDYIGDPGTTWKVRIKPAPDDTFVTRYYVIVDERDPPGPINHTMLTDKVTARKNGIPYYIAGGKDRNTLKTEEDFIIGDGEVYGGYLNYPLEKGKKYNWAFFTKWMIDGKDPVYGLLRDNYDLLIGGWPWWWLLLLLLLLLLLILLCCCLLWCLCSRYRRRSEYRRVVVNGTRAPLLMEDKEKGEMAHNLKNLENRIDSIRTQLDTRVSHSHAGKGDFEDGYVRGFRDANKMSTGTQARRRLDEDYSTTNTGFQTGYAQGLRDAGLTGLTTSMRNLAAKPTAGGYSSGYIQGFRDGNSGVYGDKITTTLLHRLEEQYPSQDDFRQGYIEGFRDSVHTRNTDTLKHTSDDRVAHSLTQLTDRLQTLEKTKGDEIHTTKVYHVYNQTPGGEGQYSAAGAQLAQELEELSSSRRSTLRRHYTPGDYLRYGSDTEGYGGSLRRQRRTLSASALGREESPGPYSPGRNRYASGTSASRQSNNDTFSRRYNYRSRSDMGRRTGSQTILDGSRPGPTTPSWRREALETLQKELDTISRSPRLPVRGSSTLRSGTDIGRGYSSDTGYLNDTWRSGTAGPPPVVRGRREQQTYDYDSTYHSRSIRTTSSNKGASSSQYVQGATRNVPILSAPPPPRNPPPRPGQGLIRTQQPGSGITTSIPITVTGASTETAASSVPPPPPSSSSATSGGAPPSSTSAGGKGTQAGALAQAYNLVGISADSSGSGDERPPPGHPGESSWTDELMKIVQEPMDHTLDRMKNYSNSLTQLAPGSSPRPHEMDGRESYYRGDGPKESMSESYSQSYREEYTTPYRR